MEVSRELGREGREIGRSEGSGELREVAGVRSVERMVER